MAFFSSILICSSYEDVLVKSFHGVSQKVSGREACPLGGLASLACKQGKYEEAEALYQRALVIRERYLGQHHPETARTLNGLAHLAVQRGQDTQAEALYRQALSIREQRLIARHPDTARSLAGLARLYLKQGEIDQPEPLMQRAATIFEQLLGQTHPETVKARNDLASLCERRGTRKIQERNGFLKAKQQTNDGSAVGLPCTS